MNFIVSVPHCVLDGVLTYQYLLTWQPGHHFNIRFIPANTIAHSPNLAVWRQVHVNCRSTCETTAHTEWELQRLWFNSLKRGVSNQSPTSPLLTSILNDYAIPRPAIFWQQKGSTNKPSLWERHREASDPERLSRIFSLCALVFYPVWKLCNTLMRPVIIK